MTASRLVLVAGPSGSGKSRLARISGCTAFRLDDFYRDGDAPGLPATLGIVDWDDPDSWDTQSAMVALQSLLDSGQAEVPVYSIAESRAVGMQRVEAPPGTTVVAEGVFAVELLAPCRAAGIPVEALYLDRPAALVFWLRLKRDLKQKRKPPLILVRRGLALWRTQSGLRRHAVDTGFTPMGMRQAVAHLSGAPASAQARIGCHLLTGSAPSPGRSARGSRPAWRTGGSA